MTHRTPFGLALPIPGMDGRYKVTSAGLVIGVHGGKIKLYAGKLKRKYFQYLPAKNTRATVQHVDVAVLTTFSGPRPDGYLVEHLNGDWSDDRASNLQWTKEAHCRECGASIKPLVTSRWICKACVKAACEETARLRRDRRRLMLKQFGLTLDEYDAMVKARKGRCDICRTVPSADERSLAVDHCHITGAVRGLLCHRCNLGIGLLGDSIDGVDQARRYFRDVARKAKRPALQ